MINERTEQTSEKTTKSLEITLIELKVKVAKRLFMTENIIENEGKRKSQEAEASL